MKTTNQFSVSNQLGLKAVITSLILFLTHYSFGQPGLDGPNSSFPCCSLIGFDATNNETEALIKWSTFYEADHVFFTVERTVDLINWEVVYHCEGKGNSTELVNYSSLDQSPLLGTSYYRLKVVDGNGAINYSEIKSFSMRINESFGLIAYPNPANSNLIVSGAAIDLENLIIYDLAGQDVSARVKLIWEDQNHLGMDISDLENGHYYFRTSTDVVKILKL